MFFLWSLSADNSIACLQGFLFKIENPKGVQANYVSLEDTLKNNSLEYIFQSFYETIRQVSLNESINEQDQKKYEFIFFLIILFSETVDFVENKLFKIDKMKKTFYIKEVSWFDNPSIKKIYRQNCIFWKRERNNIFQKLLESYKTSNNKKEKRYLLVQLLHYIQTEIETFKYINDLIPSYIL